MDPVDTLIGTACLATRDGHWHAPWAAGTLGSAFQPIVSLSHRRIVGYEALLRGQDAAGRAVPPLLLFAEQPAEGQLALDELATHLHLRNFAAQHPHASTPQWLFVNLRPASFVSTLQPRSELAQALHAVSGQGHQIVVEVTEDMIALDVDFEACAARVRAAGCLLALDDFGAGHSNFDRVWRLQPEIVKLDRSLVQRGALEAKAARVIVQMVSLLHECGSLVLMEGIETPDEAHLALDCDVDLVQGYFFGRPHTALQPEALASPQLATVWHTFKQRSDEASAADRRRIAPYADAIKHAAEQLAADQPLDRACATFLGLADAQLCYLLDSQGNQRGASVVAQGFVGGGLQRFAPMRDTAQACWARRPYFRRALAALGTVQLTRPYLSIQGAQLCVTVSIAWHAGQDTLVLCGDLAWHH
jgi:EAL domain-containing protein (putative c-di-GMP-specific phosphodiesterase class I)